MERITILDHSSFWTDSDGILYAKIGTTDINKRLDYNTAMSYVEAIANLSKGRPMPLLIDLRNAKGTFSNAAAQLLSRKFKTMPFVLCEAFVVNSLSIRLLVNSYKRIFDPNSPFELFKTVAAARAYCLNFKNDHNPEKGSEETDT